MTLLPVPGAQLFYETHGTGRPLLFIPGAAGTGESFGRVTVPLTAHYTVITYDRRGFSRSALHGPQDDVHRLETDADDVWRLLEHLSDQPVIVFGSSSGAIVALALLTRHPEVVRILAPHEPPAMKLLPDGQQWMDFFLAVYGRYRESGHEAALQMFRERTFAALDRQAMAHAPQNAQTRSNATYWFEHELRQYPAVELDLDALKARAERIVLVAGTESRGHPTYEVTLELARRLGRALHELPGGHVGFLTHPTEFAQELLQVLSGEQTA